MIRKRRIALVRGVPTAALAAVLFGATALVGGTTSSYAQVARPLTPGPSKVSRPKPIETRIPGALAAAVVQSAFRGSQLRLHNYGPKRGGSWLQRNGSYVRLSARLGNVSRRFTIPEVRKGPFRYYIKDVKLAGIQAGVEGAYFRISLRFEKSGTEIKGRCNGRLKCLGSDDRIAPDAHWKGNASIDVLLLPSGMAGGLTYRAVGVRVNGTFQANGPCKVPGDPCNAITRYKSKIKSAVSTNLRAQLMVGAVRARLAAQLRPLLAQYRIGSVQSARFSGGTLIIRHFPTRRGTSRRVR